MTRDQAKDIVDALQGEIMFLENEQTTEGYETTRELQLSLERTVSLKNVVFFIKHKYLMNPPLDIKL